MLPRRLLALLGLVLLCKGKKTTNNSIYLLKEKFKLTPLFRSAHSEVCTFEERSILEETKLKVTLLYLKYKNRQCQCV